MTFKKGQSGNPKGRPVMPQHVKEAIQGAGETAVRRMNEMLNEGWDTLGDKEKIRLVEVAMKRAYGQEARETELGALIEGVAVAASDPAVRMQAYLKLRDKGALPELKTANAAVNVDNAGEDEEAQAAAQAAGDGRG